MERQKLPINMSSFFASPKEVSLQGELINKKHDPTGLQGTP